MELAKFSTITFSEGSTQIQLSWERLKEKGMRSDDQVFVLTVSSSSCKLLEFQSPSWALQHWWSASCKCLGLCEITRELQDAPSRGQRQKNEWPKMESCNFTRKNPNSPFSPPPWPWIDRPMAPWHQHGKSLGSPWHSWSTTSPKPTTSQLRGWCSGWVSAPKTSTSVQLWKNGLGLPRRTNG